MRNRTYFARRVFMSADTLIGFITRRLLSVQLPLLTSVHFGSIVLDTVPQKDSLKCLCSFLDTESNDFFTTDIFIYLINHQFSLQFKEELLEWDAKTANYLRTLGGC